jgi:RNA polymerase sigma factor (TIGR02999 family)
MAVAHIEFPQLHIELDEERQFAAAYDDLRRLAVSYLRRERPDHTLQPTALVNEAWLRLWRGKSSDCSDRGQVLALASAAMRRILVDYARAYRAGKRFGGKQRVDLAESLAWAGAQSAELLALDEALDELARIDPRQYKIVEMIFFGGMTGCEVAGVLGISIRTVKREWSMARAWLHIRICKAY